MPRPRKTVDVNFIQEKVNTALAQPNLNDDKRGALCWLLETVLMEANAYKGFRYLDQMDTARELVDPPCEYRRYYYYATPRVTTTPFRA